MSSRRNFIKTTAAGAAGAVLSFPALSYGRILGANERLRFAVAGVNNRGRALYGAISVVPNAEVTYVCDVDSRAIEKAIAEVKEATGKKPKAEKDFRKLLEYKDVDVIAIATPEHWHAPMAIMALQAGKHVYVEKPCAHNPAEAEMLVAAQAKYGLLVQMGNQQRSGPVTQLAIQHIREGRIGKPRFAKAWYSNNRKPIGNGGSAPVPDWLDWELWQGPAPRREFQDNLVHYNWHWFRHWGTGEIHNNGTHEIDVARWALGVGFPTQVTAAGGRLFHQDDWEFSDTQFISYLFAGGEMITWEGKSCTPQHYHNRGRGVTIHGTEGWLLVDRNSYLLYDNDNKLIEEHKESGGSQTTNTLGAGFLTDQHMTNLANGIREGATLAAPIEDAYISTQLCHLGQLALDHGGSLLTDPRNGHVLDNARAQQAWGRQYEPGWEVKV
ncbi:MAG: gfo/Idh/MocA family oxidoreductase [Bacteroidetes bacterium]|nr:MAG: gfo/Idh/MocA family oxidoreductase [Bacteroidota bacterium]